MGFGVVLDVAAVSLLLGVLLSVIQQLFVSDCYWLVVYRSYKPSRLVSGLRSSLVHMFRC